MRIALTAIIMAATVAAALLQFGQSTALPRHYGDRVLSFTPTNANQLNWLLKLHNEEGEQGKLGDKVRFWLGPGSLNQESIVYVPSSVFTQLKSDIPASDAAAPWWKVQQENLGVLVENERRENMMSRAPHTKYLRYNEILEFLSSAAAECGSYCQLEDFGTSTEGRKLQLIKIGDDSLRKRVIWIDAGIHAREWIAPATAIYFIDTLVKGYVAGESTIKGLLSEFTFYIAPLLNPDGYEFTFTDDRYWRKTRSLHGQCKGVDPNRNFSYKFGGRGTSSNPCSDIYRGPAAFSEPETRAVRDRVFRMYKRTIIFLTIHSYGQMWLLPYGYNYNVNAPNFEQMMRPATAAVNRLASLGTKYRVGNSAVITYPAAGASDDWARSIGIPYSHCIELPDTGKYGFNLPPQQILTVGKQTFLALVDYVQYVQNAN